MPKKPNTEPTTRKNIVLFDVMWDAISQYRHRKLISTEMEAMRRLIQAGLDAEERKTGKGGK